MIRSRIPVLVSESPHWPPGGVAIARRGGFNVALLKPGLDESQKDAAIAWVNLEIDRNREQAKAVAS